MSKYEKLFNDNIYSNILSKEEKSAICVILLNHIENLQEGAYEKICSIGKIRSVSYVSSSIKESFNKDEFGKVNILQYLSFPKIIIYTDYIEEADDLDQICEEKSVTKWTYYYKKKYITEDPLNIQIAFKYLNNNLNNLLTINKNGTWIVSSNNQLIVNEIGRYTRIEEDTYILYKEAFEEKNYSIYSVAKNKIIIRFKLDTNKISSMRDIKIVSLFGIENLNKIVKDFSTISKIINKNN